MQVFQAALMQIIKLVFFMSDLNNKKTNYILSVNREHLFKEFNIRFMHHGDLLYSLTLPVTFHVLSLSIVIIYFLKKGHLHSV